MRHLKRGVDRGPVSIRAPHEGRDIAANDAYRAISKFQSARPMRGAITSRRLNTAISTSFNPRAP